MQAFQETKTKPIESLSYRPQIHSSSALIQSRTGLDMFQSLFNVASDPLINDSYDPFGDLMLVQEERPIQLHQIDLRTITPYQRALLAIDGTVTKFIEA